jgi:hypothetical protein
MQDVQFLGHGSVSPKVKHDCAALLASEYGCGHESCINVSSHTPP